MPTANSDFSDLLFSESGSSKKPGNQTLGVALGQTRTASAQSTSRPYDAFSALASTGPSKPAYGYSASPASGLSRNPTPSLPATSASPSLSKGGDAFGDLLSLGGGSSTSANNLSIAQRQARLAEATLQSERKRQQEIKQHDAFWDRFESAGSTTSLKSQAPPSVVSSIATKPAASLLTPTALSLSSKPTSAAASQPVKQTGTSTSTDVWGDFDSLSVAPPPTKPSSSVSPANTPASLSHEDDLLGFGGFERPRASSRTGEAVATPTSPDDFDFGDREYSSSGGLLGDDDNSDGGDDILGALSQPVRPASRQNLNVRDQFASW